MFIPGRFRVELDHLSVFYMQFFIHLMLMLKLRLTILMFLNAKTSFRHRSMSDYFSIFFILQEPRTFQV